MYKKYYRGIIYVITVLSIIVLTACTKTSETPAAAPDPTAAETQTTVSDPAETIADDADAAETEAETTVSDDADTITDDADAAETETETTVSDDTDTIADDADTSSAVSRLKKITVDGKEAYEFTLSSEIDGRPNTVSPYFSDRQLSEIAAALGVPSGKTIAVHVGEQYYWEGADMYLCDVDFYENGQWACGAACEPNTSMLAKSIYVYEK